MSTTRPPRRLAAAVVAAVVVAGSAAGCVGRKGGNDTEKQPGEQNPARNGPPYPSP